jgi:hypothetical protein
MSDNSSNTDDVTARLRRSLDGRGAPELSPELVSAASGRRAPQLGNPRARVVGGLTAAVAALAVGALVVTNPFAQQPLFVAGGAGSGGAAAASDAFTSDMRIAQWVNYEYLPGTGLSTNGGRGSVYQLERVGTAEDAATAAARYFGLDGEPARSDYYDPAYPTYVVGAQDGSTPTVYVTWTGTGNWSYNDPTAYPQFVCGESNGLYELETLDGSVIEGDVIKGDVIEGDIADGLDIATCEAPPATENLAPDEAEARALAHDLFTATGLDVAASDIRVTADEYQTFATANLVVGGVATAIDWGIAWAPSGTISWAYGHTIDVVDRGEYGTVSATDAVGRLADGRWYGAAGPDYQGGMSTLAAESGAAESRVAEDDSATREQAEEPGIEPDPAPTVMPEPLPESTDKPTDPIDPTIEPEPLPEPMPEPETVTVTIDTAEETLLLMWDVDGNAWLVPGFAMQQPEGWWNSVVSLEEGVIQLPEPVEMMPVDEDFDGDVR